MNYEEFVGFKKKGSNSPLKTGNGYPTRALFIDHLSSSEFEPLYTMQPHEVQKGGKTYPSAYQVYMHSVDEYDAAMKLVGNMTHWRKLMGCDWFMKGGIANIASGLEDWRKDMQERDKSAAKKTLIEAQADGNVTAARYLHELGGKVQVKKTKKEVKQPKPGADVLSLVKNRGM